MSTALPAPTIVTGFPTTVATLGFPLLKLTGKAVRRTTASTETSGAPENAATIRQGIGTGRKQMALRLGVWTQAQYHGLMVRVVRFLGAGVHTVVLIGQATRDAERAVQSAASNLTALVCLDTTACPSAAFHFWKSTPL